ncbi:MAG: hypothetical protein ABSH34_04525 [Verrucomicrobiota bacterium]|jgi:hypothetical protein
MSLRDGEYFLCRFAVWTVHGGNCGTTLSPAKALAPAAQLLNNPELVSL